MKPKEKSFENVLLKYSNSYGIDIPKHLDTLVEKGYATIKTSFDSLDHLNDTMKKNILKKKGVTGLSKMKVADLYQALHDNFSEEELAIVATN